MEDILNKLIKSEKKNNKKEITLNQIELEIELKIQNEKTKQLELIKDIKKIEKSIRQKELYNKKNYFSCNNCIKKSKYNHNSFCISDSESDSESDLNSDSEINLEIDSDDDMNLQNNNNKLKKNISQSECDDTLSMYSTDSDDNISEFDDYKEIDVICVL